MGNIPRNILDYKVNNYLLYSKRNSRISYQGQAIGARGTVWDASHSNSSEKGDYHSAASEESEDIKRVVVKKSTSHAV